MPSFKDTAKDLVPPALLRSYRSLRYGDQLPANATVGDFVSWDAAAVHATPYDTDLELTGQHAKAWRDSPPEIWAWPALVGLLRASVDLRRTVNICDFGGSLGLQYFSLRQQVRAAISSWSVYDLPSVVEYGRNTFQDQTLNFRDGFPEEPTDVVLANCVFQFMKDPYEAIARLAALSPYYFIFDRTAMLPDRERFMVQSVPAHLGGNAKRVWHVLDKREVKKLLPNYELVLEHQYPHPPPHTEIPYLAQVYRKRRVQ